MAARKGHGRRPNGTGWLTRRKDGRWQSALPVAGGKVAYFYGRTQAEALAKLEEAKRRVAGGAPAIPPRETCADFFPRWLATKRGAIEGASQREYAAAIRLHIAPALGAVPVAKLTPQHVQAFYDNLGARRSPATVHKLHNGVMYPALALAVRWGLATRNVAALVELPKLGAAKRRALSRDEARRFAEAVAGDELEALYLLALTTGMRQGELLGLRWADVDLDGGVLAVRQQYKRLEDGRGMGRPKSEAGRRMIALTPFVVASLRRHKERAGAGELVFADAAGGPIHPETLRRVHFYPLLARTGLPRVVFHELRHSAATILIAAGVPLSVVSRLLGHSSVRITDSVYGHIAVEDQAPATAAMGRLLGD